MGISQANPEKHPTLMTRRKASYSPTLSSEEMLNHDMWYVNKKIGFFLDIY